nr:ranBP2-like and GRIP domain-containing protein 3 isoform X1 [Pongo pygmaeus]
MRRSKADVERYIASVQGSAPSPRTMSMNGFYFAKLYYEAKEYDLAKKYICTYINVQERDPKAHRFLGLLYELEENTDKAVGCYRRSVELNPTQKDLVLKIAELLCKNDVTDGRAKYWVERAAKLFPGSPAVYKLKEQLLDCEGEDGWNKLFDLIQSELYVRPDDVHVNIRLVELYRSNKRLKDAVAHCHEAGRNTALRSSLEWNSCVVQTLKEYLESLQCLESDKSDWRATNTDLLLAYANLMLLTLSTRDVQESRELLESFGSALQSVKSSLGGNDELSATFLEMKGHFYMHAGSLLLKMGQHSNVQWRALSELAALCYLIAFQVPRPKIKLIKGEAGQNLLGMLACDRLSQSGHMLLNLSRGKQDFLKEVVETFANKSGQSALYDALFSSQSPKDTSFLGSDDIGNIDIQEPELEDLARYDVGAIRAHNGSLQHLTWLGLQWNSLPALPGIRKWLKQLFHHLPQETSRLETNAPESICILDLEVFLLGVVYTSHLQLKEKCNSHHSSYQPLCLPLPVCKQLCTERQKSWWDAVCTLIHRKAVLGNAAKLRLLVQHEINTLRAQEKHGLQPALLVHWAKCLQKMGSDLNSFYDQREYIGRSVHYWKKVLPLLKIIKKKNSIPEPIDPLFKHFHSVDIQASEIVEYEEDAHITFAILDAVNGNIEDAMTAFESIKSVVSYWNLALIFHRKAEDIENDALSPEEQEECKNYLRKTKDYLIKILDDSDSNLSVVKKLPVPLESVKEMLNSVMQELEDYSEGGPLYKNGSLRNVDSEIKHSTPSPTKYSLSPSKSYKYSPKTPPQWAEDQNSLLKMICQQLKAIKKEMQELKLNSSNSASLHRWPTENYGPDSVPDGYQGSQTFHGAPLTVATTGPSVCYSQSPAYNSRYLLRPAANVTPTKNLLLEYEKQSEQLDVEKERADNFEHHIEDLTRQLRNSTLQCEKINSDNEDLLARIETLQSNAELLEVQILEVQRAKAMIDKELEAEKLQKEEKIKEHATTVNELEELQVQLQKEKKQLQKTMQELELVKKDAQQTTLMNMEIADYERLMKELNQKLTNKNNKIEDLEQEIKIQKQKQETLEEEITSLQSSVQQYEEKNTKIKQLLVKAKKELADSKQAETDHLILQASLKGEVEASQQQVEVYKIQLAEITSEKHTIHEHLKTSAEQHQRTLSAYQQRVTALQEESRAAKAEQATITSEFESYKVQVHNVLKQQKNKSVSQAETEGAKQEREHLEMLIDQLKMKLQNSQNNLQVNVSELQTLQSEHDTLLERHNKMLQETVQRGGTLGKVRLLAALTLYQTAMYFFVETSNMLILEINAD